MGSMLVAVLVSSAQIRPPAACNTGISPTESFDMYMPAHSVTVTVPPVATIELDAFKYAGDNALVAVPQACATEGAFHFPGLRASNLADRNQPNTSYYFRIDDGWLQSPDAQYEALSQFGGCACGLVILMHGTTGHRWESVSYGAMLAGMGYLVIAPDSHAMPPSMGLKGAGGLKPSSRIPTNNYCGAYDPYIDRCGTWEKPFCYSTSAENILHDPNKYREYVERNYHIRKMELDSFVGRRLGFLQSWAAEKPIFLLGRSEGASVVARYHHPSLFSLLSGLIIVSFSCEWTYFAACQENVNICEGKCDKALPILNIIGSHDQYFGNTSSVAAEVASDPAGYGSPETGNCKSALDSQGFKYSTVVVLHEPDTEHELIYTHDNAVHLSLPLTDASPSGQSLLQGPSPPLHAPGTQPLFRLPLLPLGSLAPECWPVRAHCRSMGLVGARGLHVGLGRYWSVALRPTPFRVG